MSSYKIFSLLLLFTLAACGFQPVYSQKTASANPELTGFFRNISIEEIPGKAGQDLRNSLYDTLNPTSASGENLYRLEIKLKRDIIPMIIEKDRSITRYNLVYEAHIKLIEIASGKVIYTGAAQMSGGYDAINSDYAVYMAEGDAGHHVIRDLAEEIKNKLTSYFIKREK